jgi:DNA-binding MarR family transcriptional regulator
MVKETDSARSAPRSEGPDRYASFREAYWQTARELDRLRLRQWEVYRLTLPQLRVLFQLRRTPGITGGQLARALGITLSTASGLVGKLADRALVVRTTLPGDRRQIPLQLSEAGRALAGELAEFSLPFLDAVAVELGDDLDRVVSALLRLAEAAERVRADDPRDLGAEGDNGGD